MSKINTIIRKTFKFKNMHIVRNCTSSRCSQNLHAHTYKLELFLKSDSLDNGYMVLDFGILKNSIKELINSFNNTITVWTKESNIVGAFVSRYHSRIIFVPVSPSAESFARIFFNLISAYLKSTQFKNGETNVELHAVRVHETDTGYAEVTEYDTDIALEDIEFNSTITNSWKDSLLYEKVKAYVTCKIDTKPIVNPEPFDQIPDDK